MSRRRPRRAKAVLRLPAIESTSFYLILLYIYNELDSINQPPRRLIHDCCLFCLRTPMSHSPGATTNAQAMGSRLDTIEFASAGRSPKKVSQVNSNEAGVNELWVRMGECVEDHRTHVLTATEDTPFPSPPTGQVLRVCLFELSRSRVTLRRVVLDFLCLHAIHNHVRI